MSMDQPTALVSWRTAYSGLGYKLTGPSPLPFDRGPSKRPGRLPQFRQVLCKCAGRTWWAWAHCILSIT